jgi:putative SOS response-associated peptidase YedK
MCAQFALKIDANQLSLKYNVKIREDLSVIDSRYLPYAIAPVIVSSKGSNILTPMRFSLVPNWSGEPKVKFATHNARIETVTDKPTWRIPFQSKHCLVPLTSFFESVYEGPEAGHIIRFTEESDNLLCAAGIFDYWKDQVSPEKSFYSFSILTQAPPPFILEHGHDRTPIFVKDNFATEWLNLVHQDEGHIKEELLNNSYHPNLKVSIDRALKAGWEKRK